jgi:hypothetical protein
MQRRRIVVGIDDHDHAASAGWQFAGAGLRAARGGVGNQVVNARDGRRCLKGQLSGGWTDFVERCQHVIGDRLRVLEMRMNGAHLRRCGSGEEQTGRAYSQILIHEFRSNIPIRDNRLAGVKKL